MEIFAKVCYTELKSVIGVVCMDVKSIISQMTLEEKAALCSGKDFWHLDTPHRLLHGVLIRPRAVPPLR